MRNIVKRREPACLTAHKRTPHATYGNLSAADRNAIKKSLLEEQGYLCAYCMREISEKSSHIEHWLPQSLCTGRNKGKLLAYDNMLAVCRGRFRDIVHCDVSRGNALLRYNPSEPSHDMDSLISYARDGGIRCRPDAEFQKQLDSTLNLNNYLFRLERKYLLRLVERQIHGKNTGGLAKIRKEYAQRRNNGKLPPYCAVAIYYIDQALRRLRYLN